MNILNSIKFLIQRTLRKFGWELHRFTKSELIQIAVQLEQRGITTLLDVGANEGQYGAALLAAGYKGMVISFEPLPKPYKKLSRLACQYETWKVAPRTAVGASDGTIEINVSQNLVSSSVLPMLNEHVNSAPSSRYVNRESVPLITLDSFSKENPLHNPFIKIDTQGYEMEVLRGGSELLKDASGVQVELSIAPLYEGQPDFLKLLKFLRDSGFELWAINPGFRAPESGKLLQFDAVFFRP